MSARAGQRPLSARARPWLVALSDPMMRMPMPAQPMPSDELTFLLEAASVHGVLASVAANIGRLAAGHREGEIVAGREAQQTVAAASTELERRVALLAGQNLLLTHHADRITAAFTGRGLAAAVVKGPMFAQRLYPRPMDRSFTDIDVLVAPPSLQASNGILQELGYERAPSRAPQRDYGEYKWVLPQNPILLIEIQTDLIHSPTLRAGIRLGYADLLAAGDGDAADATALLLLAAVHGAAGHQFERLQPAVDVLQAVRGAAGPVDANRLARAARATGSTVALQSALDLTARLFNEASARDLADALSPAPWRRMRRSLVSPAVVLRAQTRIGGRDSWRRRALREIIRRSGAPG